MKGSSFARFTAADLRVVEQASRLVESGKIDLAQLVEPPDSAPRRGSKLRAPRARRRPVKVLIVPGRGVERLMGMLSEAVRRQLVEAASRLDEPEGQTFEIRSGEASCRRRSQAGIPLSAFVQGRPPARAASASFSRDRCRAVRDPSYVSERRRAPLRNHSRLPERCEDGIFACVSRTFAAG